MIFAVFMLLVSYVAAIDPLSTFKIGDYTSTTYAEGWKDASFLYFTGTFDFEGEVHRPTATVPVPGLCNVYQFEVDSPTVVLLEDEHLKDLQESCTLSRLANNLYTIGVELLLVNSATYKIITTDVEKAGLLDEDEFAKFESRYLPTKIPIVLITKEDTQRIDALPEDEGVKFSLFSNSNTQVHVSIVDPLTIRPKDSLPIYLQSEFFSMLNLLNENGKLNLDFPASFQYKHSECDKCSDEDTCTTSGYCMVDRTEVTETELLFEAARRKKMTQDAQIFEYLEDFYSCMESKSLKTCQEETTERYAAMATVKADNMDIMLRLEDDYQFNPSMDYQLYIQRSLVCSSGRMSKCDLEQIFARQTEAYGIKAETQPESESLDSLGSIQKYLGDISILMVVCFVFYMLLTRFVRHNRKIHTEEFDGTDEATKQQGPAEERRMNLA